MSNKNQSPFGKKTSACDNLIRSETKDSKVLLLASKKNLNFITPDKSSEKLETEVPNSTQHQIGSKFKRRFTDCQSEKEKINSFVKDDIGFLKSLIVLFKEGEAWYDSFKKFIDEKSSIYFIDTIPKPSGVEGEVLLCQTEFWVLFIEYQFIKVLQKNNLQRVVNLFNECLKYDLNNYNLIYEYFEQVISKFPKSIILTHISLNEEYKSKCPSSSEQINSDHYMYLLNKPEYMIEGKLNQDLESKKLMKTSSNQRFSLTEKKSFSPNKGRSFLVSPYNKDNSRKQYIKRKPRGFLIETRSIEKILNNSSRKKLFTADKESNNTSNNDNIHFEDRTLVFKNTKVLSEKEIAINISSFVGETGLHNKKEIDIDNACTNVIKNTKETIFKFFKLNGGKNILNETKNEKNTMVPIINLEEEIKTSEDLNDRNNSEKINCENDMKIIESQGCDNNHIENVHEESININTLINTSDSINSGRKNIQEEVSFSFTKENKEDEINCVSKLNNQKPINTPSYNETNKLLFEQKFDKSVDTFDLYYKVDQTTDTNDLIWKFDHTTDTYDLFRFNSQIFKPYSDFHEEKMATLDQNRLNLIKQIDTRVYNHSNEALLFNKKNCLEIINEEKFSVKKKKKNEDNFLQENKEMNNYCLKEQEANDVLKQVKNENKENKILKRNEKSN